jgi:predicted RNA binding protein with dsRBD fold (UPF0201 family)
LKRQISGDAIILKLKSDDDANAAIETISKQDFVNETKIDEQTIHLYAADGTKTLTALFELLREKSITPETVSIRTFFGGCLP